MVLEELFLPLHFFTHPQPVHHISTHPYSSLPVQMTGLYIKLCHEVPLETFNQIKMSFISRILPMMCLGKIREMSRLKKFF